MGLLHIVVGMLATKGHNGNCGLFVACQWWHCWAVGTWPPCKENFSACCLCAVVSAFGQHGNGYRFIVITCLAAEAMYSRSWLTMTMAQSLLIPARRLCIWSLNCLSM